MPNQNTSFCSTLTTYVPLHATIAKCVFTLLQALRTLWQVLGQRVSECDELRLAGSRMRYMTSEELIHGTRDTSAVDPMYWMIRKEEFEVEKNTATAELTRALGQVIYLKNLAEVGIYMYLQ